MRISDWSSDVCSSDLVELADTAALFEQPRHPYTQALLRAIPVPSPHRRAMTASLKGDVPSPLATPPGCRFHTRCPLATALCSERKPDLTLVGGDRFVACHHWHQAAAEIGRAACRERACQSV